MHDLQDSNKGKHELEILKGSNEYLDPANTTTANSPNVSNKCRNSVELSDGALVSSSYQEQSLTSDENVGCQNKFDNVSTSEMEFGNIKKSKKEESFIAKENDMLDETSLSKYFDNTLGHENIYVKNNQNHVNETEKPEETLKTKENKVIKCVISPNVFDNAAFQDDIVNDLSNDIAENNITNPPGPSNNFDPEVRIYDTYATQKSVVYQLPLFLKTALLIGNCFIVSLPFGYLIGLGVLFVEIIDEFDSTRAEAFPIISVYTGFMLGGGAILGPFLNRYNGGKIMVIGAIGTCIGCGMCYFASSIIVIVIGQGLTGIELSLTFLLPFTVVGEMFEERRETMVTVVSVFIGVGTVYFPFLISVLNEEFGWRGSFLIIGAFFLNCVPVGILIMIFRKGQEQLFCAQKTDFRLMLNCDLCKMPAFLVFTLNSFIMNTLFTTLNTFFVDMMRSRHFDVQDGPFLLSINGFASIGGRVLLSVISPFLKCRRMTILPLFLSLCSLTVLTFAYFETYTQLLVICILYGLFWGACAVLYPAVVMEISGLKLYSTALGYMNFTGGVAGLFGGPLTGAIKDATKSYDMVYYLSAGLGLLSCLLITLVILLRKYKESTSSKDKIKEAYYTH